MIGWKKREETYDGNDKRGISGPKAKRTLSGLGAVHDKAFFTKPQDAIELPPKAPICTYKSLKNCILQTFNRAVDFTKNFYQKYIMAIFQPDRLLHLLLNDVMARHFPSTTTAPCISFSRHVPSLPHCEGSRRITPVTKSRLPRSRRRGLPRAYEGSSTVVQGRVRGPPTSLLMKSVTLAIHCLPGLIVQLDFCFTSERPFRSDHGVFLPQLLPSALASAGAG